MKKLSSFLFSLFLLSVFCFEYNAQEVVRGPYLQVATHNSIVIRWRTDIPTNSKVSFGVSSSNLDRQANLAEETTEHEVKLTGLDPLTKYYYSIGTSSTVLSGPSDLHFFKTHPVPGTYAPLRAWVVGDQGKGNQGQKDVRDAYLAHTAGKSTDMWLMLGDIVYDDGTDLEYQTKCFEIYPNEMKNMPIWPTPGNHDYNSVCAIPCNQDPQQHSGPYYDIFTLPKEGEAGGVPSGTELYYSFDYGNIRFINLNSELGSATASFNYIGAGTNNTVTTLPMYQWFVQDLQDALDKKRDWIIVYWHQPPYSKGSHNSDDFITIFMKAMRENFVPVLENAGVDLMMGGHSHVYERSYMIKGHYGNSSSFNATTMMVDNSSGNFNTGEPYMKSRQDGFGGEGTVYTVLGNSGSRTSSPSLNHPVHYAKHGCDTCYGSFLLEIDGNRLDGTYIASDGTVRDQFTILKENTLVGNKPITNQLSGVKVYPNPLENLTNIEFSLTKNSKVDITLFDLSGKKIADILNATNLGEGQHKVVMEADKYKLSKGVYYLNITVNNKEKITKIIKIK